MISSAVSTRSAADSNCSRSLSTGSITGLGGGDVTINTTVSGFAVYTCTNHGGNDAPGQNQVLDILRRAVTGGRDDTSGKLRGVT